MRDFNTAGPERAGQHYCIPPPADGSGRRRLRDKLMAAFEAEPLEDGMDHPAEQVIAAALAAEKSDVALRWIRSICLDSTRPAFAAGVLLCVARLPGVGNAGWRAKADASSWLEPITGGELSPNDLWVAFVNWMAYFFSDRVMKQEIAEIALRRARLLE